MKIDFFPSLTGEVTEPGALSECEQLKIDATAIALQWRTFMDGYAADLQKLIDDTYYCVRRFCGDFDPNGPKDVCLNSAACSEYTAFLKDLVSLKKEVQDVYDQLKLLDAFILTIDCEEDRYQFNGIQNCINRIRKLMFKTTIMYLDRMYRKGLDLKTKYPRGCMGKDEPANIFTGRWGPIVATAECQIAKDLLAREIYESSSGISARLSFIEQHLDQIREALIVGIVVYCQNGGSGCAASYCDLLYDWYVYRTDYEFAIDELFQQLAALVALIDCTQEDWETRLKAARDKMDEIGVQIGLFEGAADALEAALLALQQTCPLYPTTEN